MRRNIRKKRNKIFALLIIVLGLTVGFALLSTNPPVIGTASNTKLWWLRNVDYGNSLGAYLGETEGAFGVAGAYTMGTGYPPYTSAAPSNDNYYWVSPAFRIGE